MRLIHSIKKDSRTGVNNMYLQKGSTDTIIYDKKYKKMTINNLNTNSQRITIKQKYKTNCIGHISMDKRNKQMLQ